MVFIHHLFYFHYPWFKDLRASVQDHASFLWQILYVANDVLMGVSERSGPLGVKFFFVISGFIITTLMLQEVRSRGKFSIWTFYMRRAFRILPAFGVYLGSVLVFIWAGLIIADPTEVLSAGSFLCNTNIGTCEWSVIHSWTLATEIQFYMVWPIVFVLTPARLRTVLVSVLLVLCVLASSVGLFVARGWVDNALSFACILLGVLAACSPRVRSFLGGEALWFVGGAGVVVAATSVVPSLNAIAHVLYRDLVPFAIGVVIFQTYRFVGVVGNSLFRLVANLGLISYSAYLWQQLFAAPPEFYRAPSFLTVWPLVLVIAVASYWYIEKPAIRFARRRLDTAL